MGVAVLTTSLSARKIAQKPSPQEITRLKNGEFITMFEDSIQFVAKKQYYQTFIRKGWTSRLARETRTILLPEISKLVALAWLEAIRRAELIMEQKWTRGSFARC